MTKIFEKHETLFCMLLIVIYIAVNSVCVQNFGNTSYVSFIVNTILSVCLIVLMAVLKRTTYYGLAKANNAEIDVKSSPGEGSTFTITFRKDVNLEDNI